MTTPFVFYEESDALGDGMRAHVRVGIASVDELFDVLTDALHLPNYFARSWDALDGVLGDLSWLAPRRIILVHEDVPELPAEELRVYLDVLRGAVEDWTRRPGAHELVVAFREVDQLEVRRFR